MPQAASEALVDWRPYFVPDPCAGGCGPVGGGGSGGGGSGGFSGGSGGFDGSSGGGDLSAPEAGVDFSPELFSDTLKSLSSMSSDPSPGGNSSQERRLRNILKRFQRPGGASSPVMPNRGGPGGDWDPSKAPQWNPIFAIAWHIEPVLFTIPPRMNEAWARFNREKAARNDRRLGTGAQFPQRDAATLALTNAAFDDMQAGDFAAAVEKFEKALERNPDDQGIQTALEDARDRARHEGSAKAFASLNDNGGSGSSTGRGGVVLAVLSAQEMAAYSRTVALFGGDRAAAAQADRPFTPEEAEALGPAMTALAERNYDKAVFELTRALGRNPENTAIRATLTRAMTERELQRESASAAQRAGIRGGDGNGPTAETQARLDEVSRAIAAGDLRTATDAYSRASRLDDQDRGLGNALMLLNAEEPREGLALYSEAVRSVGESDYQRAVEVLQEAVRQHPGDQGLRGALNIALGYYQQANDEKQTVGVVPSPVTNASRTEYLLGDSRNDPRAQAALEFMRQGDYRRAAGELSSLNDTQSGRDAWNYARGLSWHDRSAIDAARARAARDPDRFLLLDMALPAQRNVMIRVLEEVGIVVVGVADGVSAAAGAIIGTAEFANRTMDTAGARMDAVTAWIGEALSLDQPPAGPPPRDLESAAVVGTLAYSQDEGQRALTTPAIMSAAQGDYNTARVFVSAAAARNPDDPGLKSALSYLDGKQQLQAAPLGAVVQTAPRDATGSAPINPDALTLMGRGLLAEGAGEKAEAEAYWARMAELHGQDAAVARAAEGARVRLSP